MDIKCNFHPYYIPKIKSSEPQSETVFAGRGRSSFQTLNKVRQRNHRYLCRPVKKVKSDEYIKRPADAICAAGLLSLEPVNRVSVITQSKPKTFLGKIKEYAKNYFANIKHTYEHKIVYAMIEKELFGSNSLNSLTHDLDKLILYILGFPKSFVTEVHRKHSSHHTESGKKMNLKSMLCDNIASSPQFKPEKKLAMREYFNKSEELQKVGGFRDILEKYNYGETLNFSKINTDRKSKYTGILGFLAGTAKVALFSLF